MIKSIDDLELKDKRVFVRVDFNVPLDSDGSITDDTGLMQHCPPFANSPRLEQRWFWQVILGGPRGKRLHR